MPLGGGGRGGNPFAPRAVGLGSGIDEMARALGEMPYPGAGGAGRGVREEPRTGVDGAIDAREFARVVADFSVVTDWKPGVAGLCWKGREGEGFVLVRMAERWRLLAVWYRHSGVAAGSAHAQPAAGGATARCGSGRVADAGPAAAARRGSGRGGCRSAGGNTSACRCRTRSGRAHRDSRSNACAGRRRGHLRTHTRSRGRGSCGSARRHPRGRTGGCGADARAGGGGSRRRHARARTGTARCCGAACPACPTRAACCPGRAWRRKCWRRRRLHRRPPGPGSGV